MPLTGVNINNVSMDYFLRGVDAAKPQGVQPSQVPQEGANAQIDQRQQAVGKMVSQLDVLLMKAAMASTKGLDGKQIKGSLQTLVDQGLLDKDSFKLLAITADTAAKTLKALDKFTGRELATAIGADNHYDLNTAAVSRLDDVIARAEKLGGEGKIIEKERWIDEPNEKLLTDNVFVKKPDGDVKKLGGEIARDANSFLCTSIFVRDGLDKIFS